MDKDKIIEELEEKIRSHMKYIDHLESEIESLESELRMADKEISELIDDLDKAKQFP